MTKPCAQCSAPMNRRHRETLKQFTGRGCCSRRCAALWRTAVHVPADRDDTILALVAAGATNAEVAAELDVSVRTVRRWRMQRPDLNGAIRTERTRQPSVGERIEQAIARGWPTTRIMVQLAVTYERVAQVRADLELANEAVS